MSHSGFFLQVPQDVGESAGMPCTPVVCITGKEHAHVGTPPYKPALCSPRTLLHLSRLVCCEHGIGKGQDKSLPSRNFRKHSGLVAIVPAARGYSGLHRVRHSRNIC